MGIQSSSTMAYRKHKDKLTHKVTQLQDDVRQKAFMMAKMREIKASN